MSTSTRAVSIARFGGPVVARIVSVHWTGEHRCSLRLSVPAPVSTRVGSRPAVLEVSVDRPCRHDARSEATGPAPIAVRLEVAAGRVEGAWGFFLGPGGAQRRAVDAADALAWVRSGVHGTVTAPREHGE
jgi:hypothetical protein